MYTCNILRGNILSKFQSGRFLNDVLYQNWGRSRGKSDGCKLIIVMALLGGPGDIFKSRTSETPFAAIWAIFTS